VNILSTLKNSIISAIGLLIIFSTLFFISDDNTKLKIITSSIILAPIFIICYFISTNEKQSVIFLKKILEMIGIIVALYPILESSILQITDPTKLTLAGQTINGFTIQIFVIIVGVYLTAIIIKEKTPREKIVFESPNKFETQTLIEIVLIIGTIIFFVNALLNITAPALPWLFFYLFILLLFYFIRDKFESIVELSCNAPGVSFGLKLKKDMDEEEKISEKFNKFAPLKYTPEQPKRRGTK
jgi:hypothetical protein